MLNRKTYLVSLIFSIIAAFLSIFYIQGKANELASLWGNDYLAEIYQHSYTFNKFSIQVFFLSIISIIGSTILLIFNFKSPFLVKAFFTFIFIIILLIHFVLNYAPTDTNMGELGTNDIQLFK